MKVGEKFIRENWNWHLIKRDNCCLGFTLGFSLLFFCLILLYESVRTIPGKANLERKTSIVGKGKCYDSVCGCHLSLGIACHSH